VEERRDCRLELIVSGNDRPALAHCAWRLRAPRRIRPVQRVKVPRCPFPMQHVRAIPVPDELLFVPEVAHAWVGHAIAVPPVAGVTKEHVEPDRVHPQVRVGVPAKDVLLDPTGPFAALGSSGRDQHDQTRLASVLVENSLKVPNGMQIRQRDPRGTCWPILWQDDPTSATTPRQYEGEQGWQ
jgi:hypothetical protein